MNARLVVFALLALSPGGGPTPKGKPFGIDKRIPWTTSRVTGSPDPPPPFVVERCFPKVKLDEPIYLVPEPGSDRFFLVERYGRVRVFQDNPDADRSSLLLELKDREAYSLAFHPDYVHNGHFYLFSNHHLLKPQRNLVSRFQVSRGKTLACRADSEQEIVTWRSDGHDGGCVSFGPDGFLYASVGDGTGGSDPDESGQDLSDLLASVIRIDVDHPDKGRLYGIPKDNPFLGTPGARPEIWAYGLRNPWRFSFDPPTGNLWLGDVGQDLWEMIYLIRKGGNYGWSVNEGSHPFQPRRKRGPTLIIPPVVEHPHSEFRSIIGGLVYHGSRLPELQGAYIYGDYESGKIWGLRHDGNKVTWNQELAQTPLKIVSFNKDRRGELYVLSLSGEIHRLAHSTETRANPSFPIRLSDTGLFASVPEHRPLPGLIPYSVNSPLWSDGASKERFLALPGNSQIEVPQKPDDGWDLPLGTVLVKTFSLEMETGNPASRRRIETRLLTRQKTMWRGFSYRWNDEQTDATLVPATGAEVPFSVHDGKPGLARVQTWHFPSRTECMVCHTRAAGFVLGLNTLQMNRMHDFGGVADNQLRVLEHLGVFHNRLGGPPEKLPHLPDPDDPTIGLEERARSYLHANCSHCHVTDGGGNARMELRYTTAVEKMGIIGTSPQHESYGIANPLLVAPGDAQRSLIYQRMLRTAGGRMPPLATSVVDQKHARLLKDWIEQMKQ